MPEARAGGKLKTLPRLQGESEILNRIRYSVQKAGYGAASSAGKVK